MLQVWDEVLPTRLDDPKIGMFIVIMQRSHERDLIGHIMAKEFNGMHVCLPAEFERNHPYVFLNPKWPVPRRTDSSDGPVEVADLAAETKMDATIIANNDNNFHCPFRSPK